MKLSSLFVNKGFVKGKVDTTLFTKHVDDDILIKQIYDDDIIFESTNEKLCKYFELCIEKEFEISMMGGPTISLDSKSSKSVMGSSSIKPSAQKN